MNSGIVAELGFCSIEEREQVPEDALPICLAQGDRIAGIYEFADPEDEIKDPVYEQVFVVTERLEAIYDNFTENGNGLVSMPWNTVVELDAEGNPEWDWTTNRMTDLSTGQIIDRERRQLELESLANTSEAKDDGIG
jgi:hypothetical protein